MWLVDSGATQIMTFSKEILKNYKKINPVDVHLADNGVVQAVGTDDIIMSMKTRIEEGSDYISGIFSSFRAICSLWGV